jgi:hypothetical protein
MHNKVSVSSSVSFLPFRLNFALFLKVSKDALGVADRDTGHVSDSSD